LAAQKPARHDWPQGHCAVLAQGVQATGLGQQKPACMAACKPRFRGALEERHNMLISTVVAIGCQGGRPRF
jgi:hypothetical protein